MKNDINMLMEAENLFCGRTISAYKDAPKGCVCVWNANLISPSAGKVWYGDLNLTRDGKKLKNIAKIRGETLYVLREHDARFGTEDNTTEDMMKRAFWNTDEEIPSESK